MSESNGYYRTTFALPDGGRLSLHVQGRGSLRASLCRMPDASMTTWEVVAWRVETVHALAAAVCRGECPPAILADACDEAGEPHFVEPGADAAPIIALLRVATPAQPVGV